MGGLGHDFKTGVNFINEPRLFITFNTGTGDYAYTHLDQRLERPDLDRSRCSGGVAEANIPNKQFGLYIQDDWRVTDRLTLNLGLRYDYVDGFAIDQSQEPELRHPRRPRARAGRCAGSAGFRETSVSSSKEDTNNWQPRAGLAPATSRATAGRDPRRLRPLLRLRLHEREHPVRRDQRDGHRRRHGLHRDERSRHPQAGRQFFTRERSDRNHPEPERGQRRAAAQLEHRRRRASASRTPTSIRSAGRISSTRQR